MPIEIVTMCLLLVLSNMRHSFLLALVYVFVLASSIWLANLIVAISC